MRIHGIGFKTADHIAQKMGVPHDSIRRVHPGRASERPAIMRMTDNKNSGVGRMVGAVLTWAVVLYLLASLFGWLIQRKWGAIFIIWALWFFGAMIILGGALTPDHRQCRLG